MLAISSLPFLSSGSLSNTNAARGVAGRLADLTGISKASLHHEVVRFKSGAAQHPFVLPSDVVAKSLASDEFFFEVDRCAAQPGATVSTFLSSPEYLGHDLVKSLDGTGETVVPMGLYSDGVAVGSNIHTDSLYVIYINFLHKPTSEIGKRDSKHVFTVYRKSDASKDTLDDIFHVLLWDLQALAQGRKPRAGELHKPLSEQEAGELIGGNWGRWHKVCLMQVKGDLSYYVEALGIWQWNSLSYMCPFCRAHRDGPLSWHDFSFDAAWLSTCRTHLRVLEDMAASKAHGFRNKRCPFAFESPLLSAPFFKWTSNYDKQTI